MRTLLREVVLADPIALLAVATLVVLGELNLVAIGEPGLALHQLLAIGLGLGFVVAVQRLRSESLPWLGRVIYVLAVAMLIAVDAGGSRAYGAQRWHPGLAPRLTDAVEAWKTVVRSAVLYACRPAADLGHHFPILRAGAAGDSLGAILP